MKKTHQNSQVYFLLFSVILISACSNQTKTIPSENKEFISGVLLAPKPQIAEYIRNIIQDKKGNLWFSTNHYYPYPALSLCFNS